jgi:hypothetical protein
MRNPKPYSFSVFGGFPGRKGDGDPGWLTIWRGWQRLVLLTEGYSLRAERQRCG